MHLRKLRWLGAVAVAVTATILMAGTGAPLAQAPSRTQLVIVVDGLRPDYVTSDATPRLFRLGQRGVVFNAHHSVFPTVTRVNASSFVTGAYPETHGLLGNNIYIPKVNTTRGLDTGQRENLEAVERAEGALLTAPTLGEILTNVGKRLFVASSGSSGSALLLNHTVGNGAIVNTEFTRPQELASRVAAALGPVPAKATPNDPQNQYAIDAYLKLGLEELRPDVTLMWLNDPDGTAHAKGMGADLTRRSLALVDAGIGRIEDALRAKGLLDHTNIIVTSDHGFSTHTGTLRLQELVAPFAKRLNDGANDIVVAEGAIYLRQGSDRGRVAAIVAELQRRPEVGAIFTRAAGNTGAAGAVPGTLSFETARWNHARAGDILVSANWTDDANEGGYRGTTTQGGVAGHGASSPYDIHNTLIAAGPDFRERAASDVPTGNVDIAPTLLHLLGVPAPQTMTGRVIHEGLRNGPSPSAIPVQQLSETVRTPDSAYELTARYSIAAGRRYLDWTAVRRKSSTATSR
jgi:arylsulfatase A-like enzyme